MPQQFWPKDGEFKFPTSGVCIWVEDIKHFCEDRRNKIATRPDRFTAIRSGIKFLFKLALSEKNCKLVTGAEEEEFVEGAALLAIKFLEKSGPSEIYQIGKSPAYVLVFLPYSSNYGDIFQEGHWQDHPVWKKLLQFEFNVIKRGSIQAFDVLAGEHPFDAFLRHDQVKFPKLLNDPGVFTAPQNVLCLNVVVIPVHIDPSSGDAHLLSIWDANKRHNWWGFPGGSIIRGVDCTILDAAKRELSEELCEDYTTIVDPHHRPFVTTSHLFQKGADCEVRPAVVFVKVNTAYYESTMQLKQSEGTGCFKIPDPKGQFIRSSESSPEQWRRLHTDNIAHKEHEEACWIPVDIWLSVFQMRDGNHLDASGKWLFEQVPNFLLKRRSCLNNFSPNDPRAVADNYKAAMQHWAKNDQRRGS